MKIGFDAKRVFNNFTGLGNYSRTLLSNLRNFGSQNEYLLYTPRTGKDESLEKYKNNFSIIKPKEKGGIYWRSFGVKKDIYKEDLDIFHGLSNELPFGIKGVKKVVTIHDLIFKVLPDTYPFFDRVIYDFKSKYACQNADVILAISECTKKDIIRFYGILGDKIEVIYQACDSIYYEPLEKPDSNLLKKYNIPKDYILSVGSVVERKNLLNLVKALKELPKTLQIPLLVVGNGKKYKLEVQTYIKNNGLEDKVIWLTNLHSNRELKQIYQMAKVLVYPSLYEGFGLPVVEGMLCKTPVITSNISSLKEAGAEGALLVNPESVEEIKDAIIKVLEDEKFRKEMIKDGFEFAWRKFSPEVLSKQLLELYRKLLITG